MKRQKRIGVVIGVFLLCIGAVACKEPERKGSCVNGGMLPTLTIAPTATPMPTATVAPMEGVAISEENFGDVRFCDYLKEKFDADKNGYFSDAELAEVTEIRAGMRNILTPYSEMKGFSYFSELKRLQLNSANKVEICDVSKLSEIELAGSNSEQIYQLGDVTIKNCPQLENIFIRDMKLLEEKEVVEFTVENCPELRTMYLVEEGINSLNRMILKISGVPKLYLQPLRGYPDALVLDTAAYQSIEFPVVDVVNMKIDNSGNSYITWVGDVTTEYREPLTELAELVKKFENGFFVEVQEVSPALYDEEGRKAYQVLVNNKYLSGDNYAITDVREGYFVTYEEDAFVMYSDEPLTGDDFYFWWQELLTMPVDSYSPLQGVYGEFYGTVRGDDDDTRHGLAGYLMCRKEGDKQNDGGDKHNYGEIEVTINYSVTQADGLRLWTKIDYDYDENTEERYVAEGIWLEETSETVTPTAEELPITKEYFSNLIFRDYLEEWVDLDRNGYLSVAEREEVTGIYARDYDMGPNVVDGFEFFPNLSKICIGTCEKLVCKNCPELRLIAIFGDAPEDAVIREGDAEVVTENCPKLEVIDTAMHPDVYWDNYLDW